MSVFVIAVDPGDKHVGVAAWSRRDPEWWNAYTLDAGAALDEVYQTLRQFRGLCADLRLVVEDFVLYEREATAQIWSPMATARMIGALEFIARLNETEFVLQGALIKKPTEGHMRARDLSYKGGTRHAKDAELHLLHYLMKNGLWEMG